MWAIGRHRSPEPRRGPGCDGCKRVPVATVNPEIDLRPVSRIVLDSWRNRRGSMRRASCATIYLRLERWRCVERSAAWAQGDMTLTTHSALECGAGVITTPTRQPQNTLRRNPSSTSVIQSRPSRKCETMRCAQSRSCPKPRHECCAVGAQRRGIRASHIPPTTLSGSPFTIRGIRYLARRLACCEAFATVARCGSSIGISTRPRSRCG